jgi:N-acetylmuramoyl-L-alanine amidase
VQYAVISKTGARDRGIRARHLYVTRHTRIPAVLIEGGFITNTMESHLLNEDDYSNTLAEGIADGIGSWWRAQHKTTPLPLAQKSFFR